MSAAASSPKKASKPKKAPAAHPPTTAMITAALESLKDRTGSSLPAIKKYIAANYKFDVEKKSHFIKRALKALVEKGTLLQVKGTGASGSFKINVAAKKAAEKAAKKTTKKPVKKPVAKKAAKPKTTKPKKPKAKKATTPKKSAKKPAAKKSAKKTPTKKPAAKKAATKKTPVKKTAKKTAPAKKAAKPKKKHVRRSIVPQEGQQAQEGPCGSPAHHRHDHGGFGITQGPHGFFVAGHQKYIAANYKFDVEKKSHFIKRALKALVEKGTLLQVKGTGASGSFKINVAAKKAAEKAAKKTTKKPVKKPVAKKAAKPKTTKPKSPRLRRPPPPRSLPRSQRPRSLPRRLRQRNPLPRKLPLKRLRVTGQLEDLGGQVLEHCRQVHRGAGTHALGIVSLAQEAMDTANRELQSRSGRTALCLGACLASFTTSRHDLSKTCHASMSAAASSPKKASKPKKAPAAHPPTTAMITAALESLKDRTGSSLPAIKKYIAANYKFDVEKKSHFIKRALKALVEKGTLLQVKGTGASGSFKINVAAKKAAEKAAKKTTKKPVKKPVAKKAAKPKTTKPKKPKAKKATTPKKSAKKPAAKKSAKKTPTKKPAAKKAATKKTPVKKTAKKTAPAKKAAKPKKK
ncbi:uncharacterized protein LOC144883672 [Branchiostoma floridae x Branchiostoma japonicum]